VTVPSTVELIVKITNAVNPLRQVKKEADKTNESFKKTEDVLRRVTAASNKVKISVQEQQKSLPKLSQVQGVLAAKVRNSEQAMRAQIKALRDLQVTVRFNGTLYNKLGAEIQKYETKLKSANGTADQAKDSNNGLGASLKRLAVGFGVARVGQQALQAGIQRDESERRLRLLTQRFGESAQAQEAAQRAAEKFNLSQTEANVQLSRLIARLRPMGLSMQTIETAFAGFNTATILAGATASESAGAFLQLSQALGSGVLRGQELNSILEQAPLIAQAIATEMGSTVGALKKFGEEGEITSEIVIAALGRVEREGAGQLEEALLGPAAAIKDFQNAAEDVQVALTQDIIPEMAKSFRELADLIENLGPLLRLVGGGVGGAIGAANRGIEESRSLFRALTEPGTVSARADIQEGRLPLNVAGGAELIGRERLQELRELADVAVKFGGRFEGPGSQQKVLIDLLQKEIGMFAAPAAPDKDTPTPRPTKKSAAELRREEANQLREFLELNKLMTLEMDRQDELDEMAGKHLAFQLNEADKISLNQDQRLGKLQAQINGTEKEFALNQAIEEIKRKGLLPADEERLIAAERQIHAMDQQAEKIMEQKKLYEKLDDTFRNGIVDSIMNAVEGTKSLGESLLGVIKSMAKLILQQQLINALKGFKILGFADGGRPPVGRPSIVGERGPELFVPDRAGTIIPNHKLRGGGGGMETNVVVNVDASGSSVQGDEGSSRQLGALIGAAVQGEIIKQQRPGGLLSR